MGGPGRSQMEGQRAIKNSSHDMPFFVLGHLCWDPMLPLYQYPVATHGAHGSFYLIAFRVAQMDIFLKQFARK